VGENGGSGSSDECALQGTFTANADMQLEENICNTLGDFKTTYNVTIVGGEITLEQFVEKVPMMGSIDANCNISIVVQAPAYREFDLTLTPATMIASGTYIEATGMDCRSHYDALLTVAGD
jgi:hypothetical protein